jgi:type VI secretion system protein ImpG
MNRDFLQLYEDELRHIRERAVEFAQDYPDAAGRLSLSRDAGGPCQDPFVERMLEGFAFLTARVRLKLEAEYPRFTQGILDTVYPDYMAPWPSAAIVQFTPKWNDSGLMNGIPVPRHTQMETQRVGDTTCTFRTAHELKLHPFRVAEATYHLTDIRRLRLGVPEDPPAALRLRLEIVGPESQKMSAVQNCGSLAFHLGSEGGPRQVSEILENLFAHTRRILLTAPEDATGATHTWLGRDCLTHKGFEDNESLLPGNPRSFEGHRILREHFLLPQRNNFIELSGLGDAFRKIPGRVLDIIFLLNEPKANPEQPLPPSLFRLYCTPAINLFPVNANRIPVARNAREFQVIINRTRSLDHEVFSIENVTGFRRTSSESRPFHPFYLQPAHQAELGGFYTVFREPRRFSDREKQDLQQSNLFSRQREFAAKDRYRGSEVFLSITDAGALPISPDVEELQVRALCTNRHLPLDLQFGRGGSDFTVRNMAQVDTVMALTAPTPPRPSFAEGRDAWRAISHLSLNYLSLVESASRDGRPGAEALRALLRLYSPADNPAAQALVKSVSRIRSESALGRSPGGGPVTFIRGIRIDLTLEDSGYTGIGIFPLGSVLEQFFARHVSINHFTQLNLHSEHRKVMEWPARTGRILIA